MSQLRAERRDERGRCGRNDEEWAALVLQRYFRMWMAQAQVTRLQMSQELSQTQRMDFSEQVKLEEEF